MKRASAQPRNPLVDLLKAVAAQLIVLHHLAWYGPLSDRAAALAPSLASAIAWLADHGRYAVAVFFATGGFLAAQTLSAKGPAAGNHPLCLIRDRYLRLVLPFAAALLLAIVASALARQWMDHDSIGNRPTFFQVLAHLTLLHSLLGVESLSAGVWFVAIDFQLYALLVTLLWLGGRLGCRSTSAEFSCAVPVLALAAASLFHFNRDARWDATGLYFFGAYALGIAAGWTSRSPERKRLAWSIVFLAGAALWLDFRPRIALALATALLLGGLRPLSAATGMKWVHHFGGTSYALFLVHFPVCLVVNAAFQRFAPGDPTVAVEGLFIAWLASNLAAELFHRHVEQPLLRWQKRRLPCRIGGNGAKTAFTPA